ncbi:fructose-bisphosphate aldolase class I, partial [Candidatus Saccharibacteria bacterium]|nr:fructose-bisphosphate aldolase class I [Candidatus Saccharibacteria bacterium]
KFEQLDIPDTYENRRDYRNIFFTTPDLEKYVNGVILFDETARQFADNGQNFVDFLIGRRIIPGIKVDQGLEKFPNSLETWTKGLDGLDSRLQEYYQMGLRFAKWRSAFEIRLDENGQLITPSDEAITKNCQDLAEYAKKCQFAGIVPIVEPEVVYDGNYSIDDCASTTAKILDTLFESLSDSEVNLRACLLKCNMVLAGKKFSTPSTPAEVGAKTTEILKAHVPESLAGVVFLSGGQTVEQATNNLAEIIKSGPFPWPVTFSFARALQDPALFTWRGDKANQKVAQDAFLDRLIANTDALKKQE